MPITLAQAKVGMANHVDQQVIDQFRRGSMLLEALAGSGDFLTDYKAQLNAYRKMRW